MEAHRGVSLLRTNTQNERSCGGMAESRRKSQIKERSFRTGERETREGSIGVRRIKARQKARGAVLGFGGGGCDYF